MGEAKRRREAGDDRPQIGVHPLILARPGEGFLADDGCIAVIVDRSDLPLVAIQTRLETLPDLLEMGDRGFKHRSYSSAAGAFFGAFESWVNNERDPVPGMPTDQAHAAGMSIAFWMAFNGPPEARGRGQMIRDGIDIQIAEYGAGAVTMAIIDQPIANQHGKIMSQQTRRWIVNHGGPPTYSDHRDPDALGAVLRVKP